MEGVANEVEEGKYGDLQLTCPETTPHNKSGEIDGVVITARALVKNEPLTRIKC